MKVLIRLITQQIKDLIGIVLFRVSINLISPKTMAVMLQMFLYAYKQSKDEELWSESERFGVSVGSSAKTRHMQ